MGKGIFITGTDTDIGKTFLTAELIKLMHDGGCDVTYYKAALSGAEWINGILIAGDADYVYRRAGLSGDPNDSVSYIFKEAVSPHLASKRENREIKMQVIHNDYKQREETHDYVVMEGSGGILCPISMGEEKIMLTDIIKELELDVVVIADAGLGTINHTVLTYEYCKQMGINVKGILLNHYKEDDFMDCDNKEMIEQMTGCPVFVWSENEKQLKMTMEQATSLF